MKFLRPAAHVASMIALLCIAATIVRSAQQPSQPQKSSNTAKSVTTNRGNQPGNASPNSGPTLPPINVTVTAAPKSTAELETERKERERKEAAEATALALTRWLVIVSAIATLVGVLTAAAVFWQASETGRSAAATEAMVKASGEQFRLVHQQWLEGRWNCRLLKGDDGIEFIELHVEIFNNTPMSVTFQEALFTIVGLDPFGTTGVAHNFTDSKVVLPPKRSVSLGAGQYRMDTEDKRTHCETGKLYVDVMCLGSYTDAFDQPRTQTFHCLIRGGRQSGFQLQVVDAGIEHHPGEEPFFHPKHPHRIGMGLTDNTEREKG